jgi:hypothetical protein
MKGFLIIVLVAGGLTGVAIAHPWSRDARAPAPREAEPRQALIAAIQGQRQGPRAIDETTVHATGLFRQSTGSTLSVGRAETQDHKNACVVAAGDESTGIACDPTPFAEAPVQLVESFSAGPGGKPVRKWQVSGLALASVKRIELLDSAGRHRPVQLTPAGAFFFELSRAELAHGITGVSLLVYDAGGGLIKEVPL